MSEPQSRPFHDISRREAIARAIFLVAGLAVAPTACTAPTRQGFFSSRERRLLETVCDIILPQTDTPGARAADVHGFIDGMMQTWASPPTRRTMRTLLKQVEDLGGGFMKAAPGVREDAIRKFDAQAFAAKDAAWGQFKKLVLLGYYSSEIGATQELAYLPVPGEWRADEPVRADTRTWAD